MIRETCQTNTLVTLLAAHSAKCFLTSLQAAFASSFSKGNRPVASFYLTRSYSSCSVTEIADQIVGKFNSEVKLSS